MFEFDLYLSPEKKNGEATMIKCYKSALYQSRESKTKGSDSLSRSGCIS